MRVRGAARAAARLTAGAMVLAAAGCGGAGGGDEDSRAAEARKFEQAQLAFARCMRENGVDMPDPKFGSGGRVEITPETQRDFSRAEFERAARRCEKHRQNLKPPRLDPKDETALRDAMVRFARCMREQGIDMPDPKTHEGGGVSVSLPDNVRPDDPRLMAAHRKCQPILAEAEKRAGLPGGGPR